MSRIRPRSKRFVNFSREGWYFIFILAFIVFGSILRQINLLVILASMMIAPLLFNWRIAVAAVRWTKIKRNLPDWVYAGETFVSEIALQNNSSWLTAWDIRICDHIYYERLDGQQSNETTVDLVALQTSPKDVSHVSYRCHLGKRGVYQFGPTRVGCRYPFGLVAAHYFDLTQNSIFVAPRLGQLTPVWHKRISSTAVGVASVERKRGLLQDEIYSLRPWLTGDSIRTIHWRSTAKRGEPIVKQYDQPSDRDFALALDLYSFDATDVDSAEQIEQAVSFAATIVSKINFSVHGRIVIAICGDTSHLYVNHVSNEFFRSVMQRLAATKGSPETGLPDQLIEMSSKVSRSTPLIVVSTRPREHAEELLKDTPYTNAGGLTGVVDWIQVGTPEFSDLFSESDNHQVTGLPIDDEDIVAAELIE